MHPMKKVWWVLQTSASLSKQQCDYYLNSDDSNMAGVDMLHSSYKHVLSFVQTLFEDKLSFDPIKTHTIATS